MANPYALDFNPLASAIESNQQNELARNRLAMDEKRLGMDQTRLGWEGQLQPFKVKSAQLETQQKGEDYNKTIANRFGGVAQAISERLSANPNDQGAIKDWQNIVSHPDYREHFAKSAFGYSPDDALRGSRILALEARGFQDPLAREKLLAEAAKDRAHAGLFNAQATQSRWAPLPEKSKGVLDTKTGRITELGGDESQRHFSESYAKEQAPKLHSEASKEYASAAENAVNLKAIASLAPYAKTGFTGPIPPETMLTMRKMAASVGIANADSIAPTELYKFLAQKGVFQLTSQLKPASNLDMLASEKATASLQTDPSTLPFALPVLIRIEERKMAHRKLVMEAYERGKPPNDEEIFAKLNKSLPLISMSGVVGQIDGPPTGPQVQKLATDRLPAPNQEAPPQSQGWTPDQFAAMPDGTRTPNGKFIKRGSTLVPVGPAGSRDNPHEYSLFSGPDPKDGEFVMYNGKLYQKRGSGWGSLTPVQGQ